MLHLLLKSVAYVFYISYLVSVSGNIKYSEVKAFQDKKPNMLTQYKSITVGNETLILTGNHLVYARKNIADQFNPM